MSDRNVRNLALLQSSASTSRVLNLHSVWRQHRDTPAWAERPLFANPELNRAFIIKHRLRRDELDLFRRPRQIATKVLIPVEPGALRLGGRSVFVGQKNFETIMAGVFGSSVSQRDLDTLMLLDDLPSLDPFLLREQLKRHGRVPDRCYFNLADADLKRMFAFAQAEITPLVAMSMGGSGDLGDHAAVLAGKILSDADGDEMEPLRQTLRLAREEYAEGVFCWKGFLYYKWSVGAVRQQVAGVSRDIATVRPMGHQDSETRAHIARSRDMLGRKINRTLALVTATLQVYDVAYGHLTETGRPKAFREFLLDAPMLFSRLGEQVGALQHIASFWGYRFRDAGAAIGVEELMDIFMDFETSLTERLDDGSSRDAA